MKKVTAQDTLQMSVEERIQLVSDIWETVGAAPEAVDLTAEERAFIDERLEECRLKPEALSPWPEVYQRLLASRKR
ncbi:MAG: addiction module protein [Acidobacteria bacterium]|nr:addiction module protein [Acidobacteriota bacterium]MCI0626589.1 addiction module protein [Acidobacteriota bacterium]MCI0721188.1 addiction module protein [Acidobacteriota bacterium]